MSVKPCHQFAAGECEKTRERIILFDTCGLILSIARLPVQEKLG